MSVKTTRLVGMETAHDAAQAICPIAWSKSTACAGLALNNEISDWDGGIWGGTGHLGGAAKALSYRTGPPKQSLT
jgi:hypothetical protein